MRIDAISIFPEMLRSAVTYSILGRAAQSAIVDIVVHDLRDYTDDKRRTVDDAPYGGGAGMVIKPEPVFRAVEGLGAEGARVLLMTPQGDRFDQSLAKDLARSERLIIVCGHYEGFDERIRNVATDQISIGDYVLTGGELPCLVVMDAVVRLLPGVLGNSESTASETFEDNLLEYPQYTRPAVFRDWPVPEVLVSGHHAKIEEWRRAEQIERTRNRRPDLWERFREHTKEQN